MLSKRLLMLTLIVSSFGSIQAMVDPTFKALLEAALADKAAYRAFEERFKRNVCDVDKVLVEPFTTVGKLITHGLSTAHRREALAVAKLVQNSRSDKTVTLRELYEAYVDDRKVLADLEDWFFHFGGDVDAIEYESIGEDITTLLEAQSTRKDALAVAKLAQDARSEKELVVQTLYKVYESDPMALEDLKTWIDEFEEDIDRIDYDPASPGKKIGDHITDGLKEKATRKAALAVAMIVEEKRSKNDIVMQTLYRAYESDLEALEDLKKWVDGFEGREDVDEVDYDPANPGKKIGECITELLNSPATRQKALAAAAVVQRDRSFNNEVVRALYKAYERDNGVYDDLKSWLTLFPVDIDKVYYDLLKDTIGDRITIRLSIDVHRKEALAISKLLQGARSDQKTVLLTLFKAYEQDQKVFADLKEWQDFVKADAHKIYYDYAKNITLAQRIDALKRNDLSDLFKSTTTNARDGKKANWSKAVGLGALAAGAGLLYYYMIYKDPKKSVSEKPQALPAAA